MEQPGPTFVSAFVRCVAVLALEADAQIAWLREKGLPLVDELALEFDDGFRLVPTFIERGWLNATALPVLTRDRPTPQFDERRAQRRSVARRGAGQKNGVESAQDVGKESIDSSGLIDALLSARAEARAADDDHCAA